MEPVTWDKTRHESIEPGLWVTSIRTQLRKDNLFLYRHRVFETYVLAAWWVKPGTSSKKPQGVFCPIFVFEDHPDRLQPARAPGLDNIQSGPNGIGFMELPHLTDLWDATRHSQELFEEADKLFRNTQYQEAKQKAEQKAAAMELGHRLERELPGLKGDHPDIVAMKRDGTIPQAPMIIPGASRG